MNYQIYATTDRGKGRKWSWMMAWTWRPPPTLSWEHWWRVALSPHFELFAWFYDDRGHKDQGDVNNDNDNGDKGDGNCTTLPGTSWGSPPGLCFHEGTPSTRDVRGTCQLEPTITRIVFAGVTLRKTLNLAELIRSSERFLSRREMKSLASGDTESNSS